MERSYNRDSVPQTESLFALSNGYLGLRGSFEKGSRHTAPATLLNGFHETWPIIYPESAHGFATTGQTIVPVPDGTIVRLLVDDDPITAETTEVASSSAHWTCGRGTLERAVVYQLSDGRRVRVHTTRFVSLAQRHLAGIRYEVTALDAPVRVVVDSELTSRPGRGDTGNDPRQSRTFTDGDVSDRYRARDTVSGDPHVPHDAQRSGRRRGDGSRVRPTTVSHAHTRIGPGGRPGRVRGRGPTR